MNIPSDRPDWTDEASRFAEHQAAGLDREQSALFAADDTQLAQSAWDQAHLEPIDGYSLLEGDYRIKPTFGDPGQVKLERGDITYVSPFGGGDYSGEYFETVDEDALAARIVRLGQTTLHYSAYARKTYDVLGVQFDSDTRIYPALRHTIVFSGDDYGDGGYCYNETEIARLGYVHPGLFEPKERAPLPMLVAGRDYYRPGYKLVESDNGSVHVIEPDGQRWLARSESGISYSDPDDLAGFIE